MSRFNAGLIAVAVTVVSLPAHAAEQANVFVQRISDQLVTRLKREQKQIKSNPATIQRIVRENIDPYVDFDGFARGVMGVYFKQATPEQFATFKAQFRESLLKAYAQGLKEFDQESYTIRPFTPGSDSGKATVVMDFKTDKGSRVPIRYDLVKIGDTWKIRNVQVDAINIGLTFRNQFDSTVRQNKGNLDAAIKNFVPAAEKKL